MILVYPDYPFASKYRLATRVLVLKRVRKKSELFFHSFTFILIKSNVLLHSLKSTLPEEWQSG